MVDMMTDRPEFFNRRRHRRFLVKDSSIVVGNIDGQVVDISFGGLALQYLGAEEHMSEMPELANIESERHLYLDNVLLKSISDFPLVSGASPDAVVMRRRGMKFADLDPEDILQLGHFVKEYSSNKA